MITLKRGAGTNYLDLEHQSMWHLVDSRNKIGLGLDRKGSWIALTTNGRALPSWSHWNHVCVPLPATPENVSAWIREYVDLSFWIKEMQVVRHSDWSRACQTGGFRA